MAAAHREGVPFTGTAELVEGWALLLCGGAGRQMKIHSMRGGAHPTQNGESSRVLKGGVKRVAFNVVAK